MSGHEQRMEIGAYLLGGLEPAERATFEGHLATCRECRAEVGDLAGMPALLGKLSAADALDEDMLPLAPLPRHRVGRGAGHGVGRGAGHGAGRRAGHSAPVNRRPRRVLVAVAAVIVLIAGGAAGIGTLVSGGHPATTTTTVALAAPGTAADRPTGTAQLRPSRGGTDVTVTVTGIPSGTQCEVVLVRADGTTTQIGTWLATYEGTGGATASTSLRPGQVRWVEIRRLPDGQPLLTGSVT